MIRAQNSPVQTDSDLRPDELMEKKGQFYSLFTVQ